MSTDWAWLEEIEQKAYEAGTKNDLFQAVAIDMTKMAKCIHILRAGLEEVAIPSDIGPIANRYKISVARETLSKAARGEFE
jgi:hypothetical protein